MTNSYLVGYLIIKVTPFFSLHFDMIAHLDEMMNSRIYDRFYLLKIFLSEIKPEIWRRFVVPAGISLDRLHDVIQIVMGWQDYHLHQFIIGNKRYTEHPEEKEDGAEEYRFRLIKLIKQKGRIFQYLYDFGDYWMHEITIEDSNYFAPDLRDMPVCLEGERACPPEDVGGVSGYYEFCEAISDPNHPEHQEYMEWSGGMFKIKEFNIHNVNYELQKYVRWSRRRLLPWEAYDLKM